MRKVGYVAGDAGPRATLEALAAALPGSWLRQGDASTLREHGIGLLICGTSDTRMGRKTEAAARMAACELGIPTVVVEDFPGNYSEVPGGGPQLLVVESEFAGRLAQRAAATGSLPFHVCPSVRYDALRRQLGTLRFGAQSKIGNAVLWIGQPETEIRTRRLPPAAGTGGAWSRTVVSCASAGRGICTRRVCRLAGRRHDGVPLDECLARRPRLVVTQFSSVAIEAGFWGIPVAERPVHRRGAPNAARKEGLLVPPWCEAGAAFLISRPEDVDQVLDRALGSARGTTRGHGRLRRVLQSP